MYACARVIAYLESHERMGVDQSLKQRRVQVMPSHGLLLEVVVLHFVAELRVVTNQNQMLGLERKSSQHVCLEDLSCFLSHQVYILREQ